ncbi:MAG: bifunctional diaminohydroxyphosphoribosylaminopyrimidine deaminase/5-amino-6-(5-phosphoribosylamino)uracil reductase RibD, partial [Psittacicella sp.]
PCSHFGRTPPCALNLIKHEFKEVVIAMKDPNPIVAGSGIKLLEEAGIKVKIGLLEAEAKKLNKFYIANILNKKPFITLKLATSIDGKIQDQYGDSKWISSAKSRSDVQLSRALSMAILSSSQSIIMDDARLSIREDEIKLNLSKNYTKFQESLSLKNEIKIILDKDSKLTGYEKIFSTKGDIYIVSLEENELIKKHSNVKFIKAKLTNGQIDLNKLIDSIYKLGINSIFIECGSILATSFLKENLVDELHIYQAPFFLGKLAKNMVGFDDIKISAKKEFILNNVQTFCNDIKVVYTLKNYM